jgi:hypothetical protein
MTNLGKLLEKKIALKEAQDRLNATNEGKRQCNETIAVLAAMVESDKSMWMRELAISKRRRELVAGGDILWKPVDSTARRVVQKAPWWSFPVPVHSVPGQEKINPDFFKSKVVVNKGELPRIKQSNKNNPKGKEQKMSDINTRKANIGEPPGQQVERAKPEDVLNADLAKGIITTTEKTTRDAEALLERARDARAALDELTGTFKASWFDFADQSDKRLQEFRMFRMAMDTETRQLMASVRDVRQFFLDKDYEKEKDRLKEFVELCERLRALKESGFLDTVAETMLSLSMGGKP